MNRVRGRPKKIAILSGVTLNKIDKENSVPKKFLTN